FRSTILLSCSRGAAWKGRDSQGSCCSLRRSRFAMQRGEVTAKLKQHEADLRRLGVEHLFLFGSTARNEARLDSDLDLFFDYPRGTFGLYELIDVKDAAASILG